jgi:replicative DNA helicase
MTDTLYPYSQEAEQAVIGAVLINPEIFVEVSQVIKAGDFFIDRHRWIFSAFESLTRDGHPIDLLTVNERLQRDNKLSEMGEPGYIIGLINQVPTSLNAVAYAEIVKDYSRRAKAIRVAQEIATQARQVEQSFDVSTFANKLIDDRSTEKGKDVLGATYDIIYSSSTLLTFGIKDLEEKISGMFRKEMSILAGDQGSGKSSLMIWTARANIKRKLRVLIFSLEMQAENIYLRMACGDLGINPNKLRAGKIDENTKLQVWEKVQELYEAYSGNLIIYDQAASLQSIHSAVMRHTPDLVIIDHVELIDMGGTRSTQEKIDQLNTITRYLRQKIAKPFDCHVLLLWQLGREWTKQNRRPTKHDLYYAGTKDPDSVLLLYRPDQYDEDAQLDPSIKPVDLEVIIGKARNDYTGIIPLKYDLKKQAFGGLARGDIEKSKHGEI